MLQETTEVQELSLEKVMETKLIQNNVTDTLLATLKDKYGNLRLTSVEDKESYLEIKAAAKDCAKVRNLAVKVCKEGRDEAVKIQKQWVAKEKEVVGKVAEIEDPLDAEIARFDAEVERKANEEKQRREEAYINRQAVLTKMGATYANGCFILGEASFESVLIKETPDDIWEGSIVPAFRKEYEVIESVKVEEERKRAEEKAQLELERQEFAAQQDQFRREQAELNRQREEAERLRKQRELELFNTRAATLRNLGMTYDGNQFDYADIYIHREQINTLPEKEWLELVDKSSGEIKKYKDAEAARLEEQKQAEIRKAEEEAIRKEQLRQEELQKQAEAKRQQEEARKAEELAQSSDLEKYKDVIAKLKAITLPEMRSGQYRKKVQIIREKIGEMIAL